MRARWHHCSAAPRLLQFKRGLGVDVGLNHPLHFGLLSIERGELVGPFVGKELQRPNRINLLLTVLTLNGAAVVSDDKVQMLAVFADIFPVLSGNLEFCELNDFSGQGYSPFAAAVSMALTPSALISSLQH